MAVTIYDVARAANVSIGTVSKALNDHYSVSEATKARVRVLAADIGYRPNERARSFARQKNGTVLFAADLSRGVGFQNPHLFEIITGVERCLDTKGYSLMLAHAPIGDAPDRIRELMISERADGVILHAGILTRALSMVLTKEALPHLVVGKPRFPCPLSWMDVSHEAAGRLAADYLLDKGYRRIAFLMGDETEDTISLRRLDGLTEALSEEALTLTVVSGAVSFDLSQALTDQLLAKAEIPDVILCTNNYLAMGCLQSVRAKGLAVPRDLALMTFDNYPFSMIVQPTLTAIEVDMYEMGWDAAHFMLRKIRKPALQTQSYCTTPVIVEREST